MSPPPTEFAWTYELRVYDTGYGDYHYDGHYLETLLARLKGFLHEHFDANRFENDICSCAGCQTVYWGAFIKRYSSNETSTIFFIIGGRCYYGNLHYNQPEAVDLAERITDHLRISCLEDGFIAELECVAVPNGFYTCD